jgi:hypothetical protein
MLKRIAIAFACTLPAVALACPAKNPLDTARWIYSNHADFYVNGKGGPDYLSSALRDLLKRDWKCQEPGDQCAIDANPWTNAQDGEVMQPVKWALVSSSDKQAVVEMSYGFAFNTAGETPKPVTSRLMMVKNPSSQCWVLDNLIGPEQISLAQTLQAFPYDGD